MNYATNFWPWTLGSNLRGQFHRPALIGKHPDRQYHHLPAGKLQFLLQGIRRVIVQQPGKDVLFLKDQFAAEENRPRKFLGHAGANLLEFLNQIDAEIVAIFGVPASYL